MSLNLNRLLALAALILAIVSVLGLNGFFLAAAVICLALALIV